ncbi:nuclear pore complex protein Nup155 [Coccinella septempunctata]|uniref:nuclear pore complex protein Nup155 n=1 Tax=Coccinella septempunctata TaxID=41139 RepID=UPI001D07B583|nr:nuclear pore complex protein Nup155 [Coccinella septempunctata]
MNISRQNEKSFMESVRLDSQRIEVAGRTVENFLSKDSLAPTLTNLLNVSPQSGPTASGFIEHDYPVLSSMQLTVNSMTQMKSLKTVPLPPEIMEHFGHVQCHCMMGLFPEINRAWLTVDSDIYVWTYEENSDLAYFDGLSETILCVGLVKPKPRVFHNFIKYLLVVCTSVDIVVLGVTFGESPNDTMAEIQLIPDPVFTIPTDGATISTVVGTTQGRIFLGSKEGNVFELEYQAESGWFGKRCKKVNHSTSTLSFLVPAFINAALGEDDGIAQISVDNSRHILYVLTDKGAIEVCDLGEKGNCYSRVTKVSQSNLVQQAVHTVKTLDSQSFRPIVFISAVESAESPFTNLVAVTQTGIRLYLSTSSLSNTQPNQRPYTLCLQHVRLPPGYSANITVRPRMVHTGSYRDRNCVLVSTVNEIDVLWCISADMFPFSHSLMEAYTTLNLGASAIAVSEVRQALPSTELYDPLQELVPLVVRQHYEPPKKYVVLTSQGVHILLKLRPVDLLRQFLLDGRGADSEAVKNFFMIETEDQACATSLILASLESQTNAELAEAATRAFFIFGGEPKLAGSTAYNQTHLRTALFQPNIISTPAPHHLSQNQFQAGNLSLTQNMPFDATSIFQFSSKHNGLYLYFGRILRPVWSRNCVRQVVLDPKSKVFVFSSTVDGEQVGMVLNNLMALHNFLLMNTQLCVCGPTQSQNISMNNTMVRSSYTIQDAQLEERQSLDSLKMMVCHCCQVLGLWKILCEHQLHDLIASMQENHQKMLENTTFKDLCLQGQEMCSALITSLVNSYLGDNASVDSIAGRLRQVCPSFYKSEDAAFSKAIEMLKASQGTQNSDEKEELITSALNLCKSITPNIILREVCIQFTNLKAYKAVIELCYITAMKVDPDRIAEHFYKHRDEADNEGLSYYCKRDEIYQEILHMLDTVHQQSEDSNASNVSRPQSVPEENVDMTRRIIQEILDTDDDIMQITVYGWMISKHMTNDLIKISNHSLEMFLTHHSQQNCDIEVMDLLWKYYESNNNHSAAAKILANLAAVEGNTLNLKQRLAYLARAIMCMSSSQTGYAPCLGVYLRDLEDKLDVAKVQEQILSALKNMNNGRTPSINDAISALDSGLYQISQLYENFAEPFELWECKLAIIECAGYSDAPLVESIWKNILKNELKSSAHINSANDRLSQILSKVKLLARTYSSSVNCFPLEYLVHELEVISVTLRASKSLVPRSLISMNIPMEKLIIVYNRLISITSNESFWKTEEHEFHFAESIAALINCFLEDSGQYNNVAKRRVISLCQDAVAGILSNLYSKPNTDDLVTVLRSIQARLSRL